MKHPIKHCQLMCASLSYALNWSLRHQQFKFILIQRATLATRYSVWITSLTSCFWKEVHRISEAHKHRQENKQPDQALMAALIFLQYDSFVSSENPSSRWRSKKQQQKKKEHSHRVINVHARGLKDGITTWQSARRERRLTTGIEYKVAPAHPSCISPYPCPIISWDP